MEQEFPFTTPATSEAEMFIQWKGTNLCMDFTCPCGATGHIDADFVHYVRCPKCGSTFQMGTQVIARRAEPGDIGRSVVDLELDE